MRVCMIVGVLLVAGPAWGELVLTFNREIDIPELDKITGLDFDSDQGVLWIAGVGEDRPGTGGAVIAWSVEQDQELSSFAPLSFTFPISIAQHPTTKNLFMFWTEPAGDSSVPGGGEYTASGALVRTFDNVDSYVHGLAFDSNGVLYGARGAGFSRIDQTTGLPIDWVNVAGISTGLSAAAFDPLTGNLFFYESDDPRSDWLHEIDISSGELLSSTELDRSLLGGKEGALTGFTFSPSGDKVYIGGTTQADLWETLVVLNRIPEPSGLCLVLIGSGVLCLSGRRRNTRWRVRGDGCENASLDTLG